MESCIMEASYIKMASRNMASLSVEAVNSLLSDLADALEDSTDIILAANASDLVRMDATDPRYDRLLLTPERISTIASDCRNVATLPSPLGRVLSLRRRRDGHCRVRRYYSGE